MIKFHFKILIRVKYTSQYFPPSNAVLFFLVFLPFRKSEKDQMLYAEDNIMGSAEEQKIAYLWGWPPLNSVHCKIRALYYHSAKKKLSTPHPTFHLTGVKIQQYCFSSQRILYFSTKILNQ